LNSLDKVTLEKSLRVLKPGGQLISISGPPDAAFARSIGASWVFTYGIRAKAKRCQATYSFLFMRANGDQLTEITCLIDEGIIRPVVDRVFAFASTKEAMAYVEAGRSNGKVVVSLGDTRRARPSLGVRSSRQESKMTSTHSQIPREVGNSLTHRFVDVNGVRLHIAEQGAHVRELAPNATRPNANVRRRPS
jgi:hypothetical protein